MPEKKKNTAGRNVPAGKRKTEKNLPEDGDIFRTVDYGSYQSFVDELNNSKVKKLSEGVKAGINYLNDSADSSVTPETDFDYSRSGGVDPFIAPGNTRFISEERSVRSFFDDDLTKSAGNYLSRFRLYPEKAGEAEKKEDSVVVGQMSIEDLIGEEKQKRESGKAAPGEKKESFSDIYGSVHIGFTPEEKAGRLRKLIRSTAGEDIKENQVDTQMVFAEKKNKSDVSDRKKKSEKRKKSEKKDDIKPAAETAGKKNEVKENKKFSGDSGAEKAAIKNTGKNSVPEKNKNARIKNNVNNIGGKRRRRSYRYEINSEKDLPASEKKLRKSVSLKRTDFIVTAVCYLIFCILSYAARGSGGLSVSTNPVFFALLGSVLIIVMIFFSRGRLITKSVDKKDENVYLKPSLITAFALSFIQIIAPVFDRNYMLTAKIFAYADLAPVLLLSLSDYIKAEFDIKEILSNAKGNKFVITKSESGNLRYSVKTDFVSGAVSSVTAGIPGGADLKFLSFLPVILSAVSFIMSFFVTGDFSQSVMSASASAAVSSTVSALASLVIIFLYLNRVGGMSAVSYLNSMELMNSDNIVVNAVDASDSKGCAVHSVVNFTSEDPRKYVLCATEILKNVSSPLVSILDLATGGENDDKFKAENISAEGGKGVSCKIRGENVLLGREEYIKSNAVTVPENSQLFETRTRRVLYLAVNSEVKCALIVSYQISRSAVKFLKKLVKTGKKIIISSSDPGLDAKYFSDACREKHENFRDAQREENEYFISCLKESRKVGIDVYYDGSFRHFIDVFNLSEKLDLCRKNLPAVHGLISSAVTLLILILAYAGRLYSISPIAAVFAIAAEIALMFFLGRNRKV